MRIHTWTLRATWHFAPTLSYGLTHTLYAPGGRALQPDVVLSSCWPDELARVADAWADAVLHDIPQEPGPDQPQLPYTYRTARR